MTKNRVYVACTSKSQYIEVLKYKARNRHVWRKSQQPVFSDNESIREWDINGIDSCLGIHNEGGVTRSEVARKKGTIISFNEFKRDYVTLYPGTDYGNAVKPVPCEKQKADNNYGYHVDTMEMPRKSVSYQSPKNSENIINNKKEEKMTKNSMFDAMIPSRINPSDVVMTMSGKIAYRRKDGDYVRYDKENDAIVKSIDIMPSFPIGEFCMIVPTPSTGLSIGDIIFHKNDYKEVTSLEGGIKTVNLNLGTTSNIKKETIEFINVSLLSKVVCFINGNQTSAGTAAFNPMMLMMLSKDNDGGSNKFKDMLPMLLMSGGLTGGADASNPMAAMLPMLLMSGKDGGDSSSMMEMMMMSQMVGGQGGANPFAAMFGGATKAVETTVVETTSAVEITEEEALDAEIRIAEKKAKLKALKDAVSTADSQTV